MMRTSCFFLVLITAPLVATAAANADPKEYICQVAGTDMHHVGTNKQWATPKEEARRPNPVPVDDASIERGRKLYQLYCVSCHGNLGEGDGPAGAALTPKPSNLREMGKMHPAGDLAWKISTGRGPMPAWKGILTESQIWDLVNFIMNFGITRKGP